MKSLRIMDLSK